MRENEGGGVGADGAGGGNLVDAGDSKPPAARRAGSIPASGTTNKPVKTQVFTGFVVFAECEPIQPGTQFITRVK